MTHYVYPVNYAEAERMATKLMGETHKVVLIVRQGDGTYWITTEADFDRIQREYRSYGRAEQTIVARWEPRDVRDCPTCGRPLERVKEESNVSRSH